MTLRITTCTLHKQARLVMVHQHTSGNGTPTYQAWSLADEKTNVHRGFNNSHCDRDLTEDSNPRLLPNAGEYT